MLLEVSSVTVTLAAVPLVSAAILSVCVVTNVCIWSAVARPVPPLAIAAVTTVRAGEGPVPFAIVNWFVVAEVIDSISPAIDIKLEPSCTNTLFVLVL